MDGTVLIADDDRTIRTVLSQALGRAGCRVHATGSLSQLVKWVEEGRGDLVITDVMMPDGNGIDTIPAIRACRPELPVIVISAQNTIVTAIRATEADAFEYLPKPFDLPELLSKAGQAMSLQRRRDTLIAKTETPAPRKAPDLPLIGHAPAMQAIFRMMARVMNADLPIMIAGEQGVGKSTIARSLHGLAERADNPLIVLSPSDGSPDTFKQKLAAAAGGTLLIEDPAGFEQSAQLRMLDAIDQWGQGDKAVERPRIISTASSDPARDVEQGRLRSDLYYRLAGITIPVPPLRSRVEDIVPLAHHLLARAASQGMPERDLTEGAMSALRAHDFPGNVRELENLLQRLALTSAGASITEDELRDAIAPQGQRRDFPVAANSGGQPADDGQMGLGASVEMHLQRYFDLHGDDLPPPGLYGRILREIEVPLLEIALDATGGNQLRCADLLGINRNTLRKKLSDLNIEVTRRRKLM